MSLRLVRDEDNGKGTLGKLYYNDEFLCFTLENTWKDNEPRVSCIPPGEYPLETKTYGKYYQIEKVPIPILRDVPNRSEILIHWGNYPEDTLGCILVGDNKDNKRPAVWNSKNTWRRVYTKIAGSSSIVIE